MMDSEFPFGPPPGNGDGDEATPGPATSHPASDSVSASHAESPSDHLPALSGDLARFRVHDLCQLLAMAQSTGQLYLRAPGVHGRLEIEAGQVVGACMRPNPSRLGHLLRAAGKLEAEMLGAACARQIAGDRRPLGAILAGEGAISPADLEWALGEQDRAALEALLVLPAGRFAFKPGPAGAPDARRRSFDVESLLLGALTRLDELSERNSGLE
jgi:hypothetical protein